MTTKPHCLCTTLSEVSRSNNSKANPTFYNNVQVNLPSNHNGWKSPMVLAHLISSVFVAIAPIINTKMTNDFTQSTVQSEIKTLKSEMQEGFDKTESRSIKMKNELSEIKEMLNGSITNVCKPPRDAL